MMPARSSHPIDLNTADAWQLRAIEGMDERRARLILDYRSEHGPFRSWDEVRKVPGVSHHWIERARDAAVLGAEAPDGGGDLDEEDEEDENEDFDREDGTQDVAPAGQETIDREELEALGAIAQLDLESAAAYETAAMATASEKVRRMMLSFRDDHRRHVEELSQLVRSHGADFEPVRAADVDRSTLVQLAATFCKLDPGAALEALLGSEQLTHRTYETASWLIGDDRALEIVERNRRDERHHVEALTGRTPDDEDDGVLDGNDVCHELEALTSRTPDGAGDDVLEGDEGDDDILDIDDGA
ncbi:MAG: helix-hairpin-helix domain-containing protein [Polyangiaceae bacterium]